MHSVVSSRTDLGFTSFGRLATPILCNEAEPSSRNATARAFAPLSFTAVAMHSATEAALKKLDLIDFLPDSEGKPSLAVFQGRRVIVDDTLPTRAGTTDGTVYTTYLFGQGAFAKGVAPLDGTQLQGGFGTEGVELARVPLDSDSILINRRRYILHPRGVKFTSVSVAGDSPKNLELENEPNWVRVWENKNVRLVAITHNN